MANKAMSCVHFKLTDEKSITIDEIKKVAKEKLSSNSNASYLFVEDTEDKTGLSEYNFSPSIIHKEPEANIEANLFNMHISQPTIIDTIHNLREAINGIMDIKEYYETVIDVASNCEVLAIFNDFNDNEIFELSLKTIKGRKRGIIMIDGNNTQEIVTQKLQSAERNGACAVGIDFTYCYNINELNKIHFKTEKDLAKISKQLDIPLIIKGISSNRDLDNMKISHINNVYFSNNNKYALKGMEKVADTVNKVDFNSNHHFNILAESPRYGVDVFKYLVLGANAVCVTEESFISIIGKGRKGLEYLLYSNRDKLEKMIKLFGQTGDVNYIKY